MTVNNEKKLFVLDTNVLIHDPTCLFRFQEHDIFLPMVVLEELDKVKKGNTDLARNVRQVSRFLNDLMEKSPHTDLHEGIRIVSPSNSEISKDMCSGRLFFQSKVMSSDFVNLLPGAVKDNQILDIAFALKEQKKQEVILVSKDINLRIKASIIGMPNEDYFNDQVIEDSDLLYTGMEDVSADFWETHSKDLQSWSEEGRTFYKIAGTGIDKWVINQGIFMADGNDYIVRELEGDTAVIERLKDYTSHAIWGIKARNREQNFALNLLLDPEIDFVSLLGQAGTGKTLLTLAAALQQTLEKPKFNEIIMTRATINIGEDIGFLPGSEEEKMTPWMGALMDNLEVLNMQQGGDSWGKAATSDLLSHRIKIRSLNFMRGRTFQGKFLILDEAQNLTAKQMKTLITRAGPDTKVVCMGNLAQIDTPFLTETSSGLTYVVDHFKSWKHSGHITLKTGERSRLAEFAASVL